MQITVLGLIWPRIAVRLLTLSSAQWLTERNGSKWRHTAILSCLQRGRCERTGSSVYQTVVTYLYWERAVQFRAQCRDCLLQLILPVLELSHELNWSLSCSELTRADIGWGMPLNDSLVMITITVAETTSSSFGNSWSLRSSTTSRPGNNTTVDTWLVTAAFCITCSLDMSLCWLLQRLVRLWVASPCSSRHSVFLM